MSEARTGKRFPLELTTTIHEAKAHSRKLATTSDLSAAGVFITGETHLKVGSNVEFDITLPKHMIGAAQDVQIRCKGRVVRSEEKKNSKAKKSGVACVIDSYKFVRK